MALTDLTLPSSSISLDDAQTFTVFALSFKDVEYLVENELTDLDNAVRLFGEQMPGGDIDTEAFSAAMSELLASLYTQYPSLTARIIACASGDRSEAAVSLAGRLPLPVQADALLEIFRLTFSAPGGIKKFVASVAAAVKTLAMNLPRSQNETAARLNSNTGSTT